MLDQLFESVALFRLANAGDVHAAIELHQRYRRLVKSVATRYVIAHPELRSTTDSDDLSQEAWRIFFARVADGRMLPTNEVHVRRTFALLVKRVAQYECRRQRRAVASIECYAHAHSNPGHRRETTRILEDQDAIEERLRVLESQDRRIVMSRCLGMSYSWISRREGLTVEATRSRFRRAIRTIGERGTEVNSQWAGRAELGGRSWMGGSDNQVDVERSEGFSQNP